MGPDAKDMKSAVAAWNSAPRAEGQVSAKVKIYQCENPICGPKSGTYVTIGDGPHWGYCGCGGRWMRASVDIGGDDSKPTKNDIKRLKDDLSNALKKAQAALSDIVKECDE